MSENEPLRQLTPEEAGNLLNPEQKRAAVLYQIAFEEYLSVFQEEVKREGKMQIVKEKLDKAGALVQEVNPGLSMPFSQETFIPKENHLQKKPHRKRKRA